MEDRIEQLERNQERFVDLMLGPPVMINGEPVYDIEGSVIRRSSEGMKYRVDYVYNKLSNGPMRISLSKPMWVTLIAAVITGVFGVVAAFVG